MERLDFRGLACPQPVLKTKACLDANPDLATLCVCVDNAAASENVTRFMENQGFAVTVTADAGVWEVAGTRDGSKIPSAEPGKKEAGFDASSGRILVMLANDRMGRGDAVLGTGLMKNFLLTLKEMGEALWRVVCVNEAVKLTITGADTLASLKELEAAGVDILVCGTCLEHYGLLEEKQVGTTTNMLDIVTSLEVADKVINL